VSNGDVHHSECLPTSRIRETAPPHFTPPKNACLEYVKPNPAAPSRLFCLPFAGGGASIYRQWHGGPLAHCEVCPVQLPGRESRIHEAPYDRMARLAGMLAESIPLDKPFALFGHSMGALLAFEIARELRGRGRPAPFHLFVSGAPAPHLCPNRPLRHRLKRDLFIAEIRKLGGTPEEVFRNEELLELALPILRADFATIDTYVYRQEEPHAFPITAFAGDRDHQVDQFEVMLWRGHTLGQFAFHQFAGDHFFLNEFRSNLREIVGGAVGKAHTD
jgi:medium-chain acyl-[acyl-carrier-protein] hydrolase